jgi:hypothetical protein
LLNLRGRLDLVGVPDEPAGLDVLDLLGLLERRGLRLVVHKDGDKRVLDVGELGAGLHGFLRCTHLHVLHDGWRWQETNWGLSTHSASAVHGLLCVLRFLNLCRVLPVRHQSTWSRERQVGYWTHLTHWSLTRCKRTVGLRPDKGLHCTNGVARGNGVSSRVCSLCSSDHGTDLRVEVRLGRLEPGRRQG